MKISISEITFFRKERKKSTKRASESDIWKHSTFTLQTVTSTSHHFNLQEFPPGGEKTHPPLDWRSYFAYTNLNLNLNLN
jgi:hypothetical protein